MSSHVDTAAPGGRGALWRWVPRIAVAAAIAAIALWVHLFEFQGEPQWDSAAFLAIGKLLTRGLLLYRDVWDTKPPGIYLYQILVYTVLPLEVWSLRITDYLLYAGAGLVYYWLCRREVRWPLALAGTGLWLYFSHHPSFNIAGFYTEEYMSIFAIGAVACAARYWQRGGRWPLLACGLSAALAVLFKHPGVACGAPILVLISGRRPLRAVSLVTVAGATPLLVVLGYFWWRGALDAFLDCQFLHLLAQHGITQPVPLGSRLSELFDRTMGQLTPYPIILIAAGAGGLVCLARPTRLRLAAVAWLCADLTLIGAQKFYYEHYFIQLFPSAILCGVLGAGWLLQWQPNQRWVSAAARLGLCVAAVALALPFARDAYRRRAPVVDRAWQQLWAGPAAWPRAPGGRFEAELGRYLHEHTMPADRIYIYETGTALAAYWTAERLPASRYFFSIVPQSSPGRMRELLTDLEQARPAYIVVTGGVAERPISPLLREDYLFSDERWGGYRVEIWRRKDFIPSVPPA